MACGYAPQVAGAIQVYAAASSMYLHIHNNNDVRTYVQTISWHLVVLTSMWTQNKCESMTTHLIVASEDPVTITCSSYCRQSTEPVWPLSTLVHSSDSRSHTCKGEGGGGKVRTYVRRDRQREVAEQVEVVAKIQGEQALFILDLCYHLCILDLWHMYANTYMYVRMFVLMLA